jgi:two-component system sensor histidine kinase RegB
MRVIWASGFTVDGVHGSVARYVHCDTAARPLFADIAPRSQMDDTPLPMIEQRRSNWVRLRTLIVLRWIAIAGQLAAIFAAQAFFDITLDVGLCYLAVGAAVVANLVAIFIYPENKRLSEEALLLMLVFDIAQLGFLLYLTGGLNNPFATLMLAPVTISATTLQLRSTLIVGATAAFLVTLLAFVHDPLVTTGGATLALPATFLFGFWAAILIGILFVSAYAHRVTSEVHSMSDALLATQMALAREQKLTDLGGVVAAAAHELGTPLATIKLASSELIDALDGQDDLQADARLIREQADRCRDILRGMGRTGKSDAHLKSAPLSAILREAADPHANRGRTIVYDIAPAEGGSPRQPVLTRQPEIIHGLRNLVQNAVDFAASTVWIDAFWTDRDIVVRIIDDGAGFPPQVLGRIGDPFVSSRRSATTPQRPGYEGMGLGLFIAKTLLERTGANLVFANGTDPFSAEEQGLDPSMGRQGAIVEVTWARSRISRDDSAERQALGENLPIVG